MNVVRLRYPPPARLGSAADLPWDQIIQAGTEVTTTAIQESAKTKRRKHRKKKASSEEEAPTPTTAPTPPPAAPIPWGPILLVAGVLGGAIIYASGSGSREKRR